MQASRGGRDISYPLGEVEGSNPQGPEAAQHGEQGQAQVVPGRKHQEMVLAFAVTGGVALQKGMKSGLVGRLVGSSSSTSVSCPTPCHPLLMNLHESEPCQSSTQGWKKCLTAPQAPQKFSPRLGRAGEQGLQAPISSCHQAPRHAAPRGSLSALSPTSCSIPAPPHSLTCFLPAGSRVSFRNISASQPGLMRKPIAQHIQERSRSSAPCQSKR